MIKICKHCYFEFEIDYKYRNRRIFCSNSCSVKNRYNRIKTICNFCSKAVIRTESRVNRNKTGNYFCDLICRQKFGLNKKAIVKDCRQQAARYFGLVDDWKCSNCGYQKCKTAIEVHHKDRDKLNNAKGNLILLCANCHIENHYNAGDGKNKVKTATVAQHGRALD